MKFSVLPFVLAPRPRMASKLAMLLALVLRAMHALAVMDLVLPAVPA